ncbi:hypothetical protein H9X80_05090 [Olsenella profusa]|uniref:Uncharacterized protein n=2 Tax=Olsenella profusa TaxID=138595 RepID=A0ABS2F1Q3_9ACTN|nr:hypothetical protein [Olsenella profusa]
MELGMYPWVAQATTSGGDSLYSTFLDFSAPEYEKIGEQISEDTGLALSAAFLNSLYNGPSDLSSQHLYEAAILSWLAFDEDSVSAVSGSEDAAAEEGLDLDDAGTADSAAGILTTLFSMTAENEADLASEYDRFLDGWKGLTGEDLGAHVSGDSAALGAFSDAVGDGWFAAQSAARFGEAWSGIDAALGADEARIVLLEGARDRAAEAGNNDFAAAADRVLDAYRSAVDESLVFDEDGVELAASQMTAAAADVVMSRVWDALSGDNPILSLGMDGLDLVFSTGEDADANMGMLVTYMLPVPQAGAERRVLGDEWRARAGRRGTFRG